MSLLDTLVSRLTTLHPLPWRIDLDWTVEVQDADGRLIVQTTTMAEARELIWRAEVHRAEMEAFVRDELPRLLKGEDP